MIITLNIELDDALFQNPYNKEVEKIFYNILNSQETKDLIENTFNQGHENVRGHNLWHIF